MNTIIKKTLLFFLALSPCLSAIASLVPVDTTYYFRFEVNMSKAVRSGFFDPDSDKVWVEFQESLPDLELAKSPGNVFNGILLTGLDSGAVYHFSFRINDTIHEDLVRSATALPGTTTIWAWWNNDYLNITTFTVDLSSVDTSLFHPGTDGVYIEGTVNPDTGKAMQRVDTTLTYRISLPLNPDSLYTYYYRVIGDTVFNENTGGYARMFLPPDTLIDVVQYFSNLGAGKIAMRFLCGMTAMINGGLFDPERDFLDIAGNFNNWGAWDLCYDVGYDSLYRLTLLFDTALIGGPPLEFKFRIDSSWALAELQGKDPRQYQLKSVDTAGVNPNFYECWYNNISPYIPSPPWVTDLIMQGKLEVGYTLSGAYLYHHWGGIPEGYSLYQWYRADSIGAPLVPIDTAQKINYTVDSLTDIGKYLIFEVTPVAAYGDSLVGKPTHIWSAVPVPPVGIEEYTLTRAAWYPNPSAGWVTIETPERFVTVAIVDFRGNTWLEVTVPGSHKNSITTGHLPAGMYIIRFVAPGKTPLSGKLINL